MASKLQIITAMFNDEVQNVTKSRDNWTAFLKTAANNYKYNFPEQLLIFAQRRDATACAEIGFWNERFDRWVNRGAKGIALFDNSGSYQRLRYVFDVSDTNSRHGIDVPVWKAEERYYDEISEALINAFGDVAEGNLESVIDDTSRNMAEDNAVDYIPILQDLKESSSFVELSENDFSALFKNLLSNSVGYMMMSRCGFDADSFYSYEDFKDINIFNTYDTVVAFGTAVSQISEMGLREIESTVRTLQINEKKLNRTFERNQNPVYDGGVNKSNAERSNNNGTDNLQTSRGLSDSEPDFTETGENTAREIRTAPQDISEGTQTGIVEHSYDQGRIDETSSGDRRESSGDDGQFSRADEDNRGRDGGAESIRSDEMGSDDEQHSAFSGGDSSQGSDLQLSNHDFNSPTGIDYFYQDKEKNELIKAYLSSHTEEIAAFFESHSDKKERGDFLMSFFTAEPFEMMLSTGVKAGFDAYGDALRFWRGDKDAPERESWEKWFQITNSVYGMILLEEWTEPEALRLPDVQSQMDFLNAKSKNDNQLYLPQAAIDYILCRGSGVSEGKMRIFKQFSESLSKNENVQFLRSEYGTGGHSDAIPGSGYWESHDGKGIEIADWNTEPHRKILLSWNQVEKRISELIKADRYLNVKEKEVYPGWLEQQEELRIQREEETKNREILSTAPQEKKEEPKEYTYEYHLGDTVYIGADEYSIISLENGKAILSDNKFPIFTCEFAMAEFEEKVKENPSNDHLKVEISKEKTDDFVSQLAAAGEYCYNYPDKQTLINISYNPDSVSGGQFVVQMIPYSLVLEASRNTSSLEEFHSYIDDSANTELVDIDTDSFNQLIEEYKDKQPDVDYDMDSLIGVVTAYEAEKGIVASDADFSRTLAERLTDFYKDFDFFDYQDNLEIGETDVDAAAKMEFDLRSRESVASVIEYLNGLIHEGELNDDLQAEAKSLITELSHLHKDNAEVEHEMQPGTDNAGTISDKVQNDSGKQNPIWQEYLRIKNDYPDSILLYQIGDFFEIMGDDVQKVAESLGLYATSRKVGDEEKIPMCGFPKHSLETYVSMLGDRGYDVAVSSIENGERKTVPIVSANKEDPVESKPVGRIDYLHTDGRVRESIEYTSEYQFKKDVQEENFYGVPMTIVVYKDKDGHTIPTDFVESLDPPPQGFFIEDSPYLSSVKEINDNDLIGKEITIDERKFVIERIGKISGDVSMRDVTFQNGTGFPINRIEKIEYIRELFKQQNIFLEKAKGYISDYCKAEFGEECKPDFSDLSKVPIAFTTISDEDIPIQVNADLVNFKIERYLGNSLIESREYQSLTDLMTFELRNLDFSDLVYVSDEDIVKYNSETAVTPSWEQKPQKSTILLPEIPESEKHDFRITDDNLGVGGPKEKFRINMAAINLLHELEFENRLATPEEQEILSKYVGFGGLADAFDESKENWANEFAELYAALSPEEYAAARESTLTAFYTPPVVIRLIYQALENMGFKTGNILEPACGTGNFMGMLPESMKDSKFFGIELDSLTGRIAQQLYQKANIAVQGYESTNLPDSFFDIAVGNVPFGQFKVSDKKYDKNNWNIHDYFFGKTLDKVRPGGVIAFVTSSWTMDKKNPAVRKYIAQRADLLGAIRLPNNTFKANAGTDVTSDILFLQKRDTLTNEEPAWVHLGLDENGHEINQYFVDNPDMILGEMIMESSQYGQSLTCKPYDGVSLDTLLSAAIQDIHADYTELELSDVSEGEKEYIPADPSVRNFSYTLVDGKIYYRENSRMNPVDISSTAENRIKGMIEIRDCVRKLIALQTEDYPDFAIESAQERLNSLYDKFTEKYGLLNSRANKSVFSSDSSYSLLCSLEVIGENGELKRKADMFTKRTIKPNVKITAVGTASEALAVSIGEKAKVDMEYMCELTGKSEQEIFSELKGVIFLNPEHISENDGRDKYLTADEYLSGNVREKLALAKSSAELYPEDYTVNVEMLEKVQPVDLDASEISVRLGATWLPESDVKDFMFELLQTPHYAQWNIKVHYSKYTAEWNIENKSYDKMNVMANNTYGTDRINAYKIIEETLNLRDVRIFDYVEDANGNRKAVLNKKETAIAQGKQELIKQAFQDWIWKDPQRRERLVRMYNDLFNSMRPREYDGSHIAFSGMNPEITLRPHQINAIARIMYGGNTLLAHVVGAGKTFEIVAAAQESKRLGLCNKSLIVVPNHLTEQWASEYLQLYPSANILVATKKDFETKNRKQFCARIATGDYDAVIIGHSQFEKIPLSADKQRFFLQCQIDEITQGISEMKFKRNERFTVKQLEKTKKSLQAKLQKLNDQTKKDDVVTFEELGVDRLFVDEAHNFKNLFLYTKMRNVGGIAQTEAQKSSDLYTKCRYLDELTGSKGVIFATGTPVSNSMVELYTMQRYLQYNTLVEKNLQHFDSWASTFGETVTAIELAPEGTGYRSKTRFAKFYNLPELMMMFRQIADIQTADMLKLPVPKANYHNISVKPTDIQKDLVDTLSQRAERVRNKMVDSSVDNMLLITNDGRKLALDQRLSNELLPDDPNSKISACVNNVYDIWERTAPQKSAQLIFCDLSTPHNDGKFNVYTDMRSKLIARGIPEKEIAFIHDADSEAKKKELFSKVRSGQVRVLMGSTAKMGAGTNVQQKLIALHHTDCPWRPADLQQREGRIIRQGNENPEVEIYTYVTEQTFDAYLYQLVENKQKFIGQIMTSKSPVRSAEDVDEQALSYAEIKALATGNPYIKEKMDLDIDVSRLKLLKQNHLSQRYSLEDKILKFYPAEIKRLENKIEGYTADIQRVKDNTFPNSDGFSPMIIDGISYAEKKDAGAAILAACKAMTAPDPKQIGSYRGFNIELSFDTFGKQYIVTLVGSLRHQTPLGPDIFGNIQRIDHTLADFEKIKGVYQEHLEDTHVQLSNAKEQVEKPFPQEEELKEKTKRLAELNALLDMDHKENEIVDGEIADNVPGRNGREIVR